MNTKDGPLGLQNQINDMPTTPLDRGDDTQERFRYQWAIGVAFLAAGLSKKEPYVSVWCEYHDDFLIELHSGKYIAAQVKTDGNENALWKLSDDSLQSAITRFCTLEAAHGNKLEKFLFCSNAKPYIPGASVKNDSTLAKSPTHLVEACRNSSSHATLAAPYKLAFENLKKQLNLDSDTLFNVLRKLEFVQGPSLQDYESVMAADIITSLPGCKNLSVIESRQLRDGLMNVIQSACRINVSGIDCALRYLASNGQPIASIRNKCITISSAQKIVEQLKQPGFQFVECGLGIQLGKSDSRTGLLETKMRNAYIGGQFEGLRWRMVSADQRLMERAIADPETFEELANQLTGTVLLTCKDAEAKSHDITEEKQKGPVVYAQVLAKLEYLAENNPKAVGNESADTLMGVAAMLSGDCRFTWGIPLEEDHGT